MNRSRTLILLGIVLLLGAVVLLVLAPQNPNSNQAPTPPPPPVVQTTTILVAAQNIPRGTIIGPDAVVVLAWPNTSLPPSELILTGPDQVKSTRARTDIYRGQPVLKSMITAGAGELASIGYDAALFIPPGKIAVSFPIDKLSSVGYAVGTGDHVDILLSFSIVDANRDGQFPSVPFNQDLLDKLKAAGVTTDQTAGKADQQPRLLAQMALQNIEVLHVGEWPVNGAVPNTQVQPTPNAPAPSAAATPTPVVRPTLLLLLVDPQQALILEWLRAANINLSLGLRAAGDNAPRSTDTVTYQYILSNFNITIPPKLDTLIQGGTPAK